MWVGEVVGGFGGICGTYVMSRRWARSSDVMKSLI